MTSDKIKHKLNAFIAQYQEKLGTFNGNLVIYDFMEFITTETTVKKLMKDQFAYFESQKDVLLNMTEDELDVSFDNITAIDPMDPSSWPKGPIFAKEHENASNILTSSRPFNLYDINLPISLTYLSAIHMTVGKAKEEKGNPEKTREIAQVLKELSTTLIPFKYKDKDGEKSLSMSLPAYCLNCLKDVSSYIANELDSKDFLEGTKPQSPISFDKEESVLNIKGDLIKITLRAERPIDHFILEAIFDNEDLSEEIYFKDVAKKIDEFEDYDSDKDWRKFYRACQRLNLKIEEATSKRVVGFIESHTGKRAWCKINPKYLKY
ncbi:MAG: hypothetical protein Q8Q67_00020 [bacterium]|nr:hypothetical protein [bacterium]